MRRDSLNRQHVNGRAYEEQHPQSLAENAAAWLGHSFTFVTRTWNFVELLRLALCFLVARQWLGLLSHPENTALDLPALPQTEVSLRSYAADYRSYKSYNGLCILVSLFR
jgi:hypothetical protein